MFSAVLPPVKTKRYVGWDPEPVWTFWRRVELVTSSRNGVKILRSSSREPSCRGDWCLKS